jgi:hypothetical protein
MSTNLIDFNYRNQILVALEKTTTLEKTKDNGIPASDMLMLHKQLHDNWRWYGIKPELRRLYELWAEIEAEDKAKSTRSRRAYR